MENDYENVILDLERRRAAYNAHVDALIQGLRTVVSAGVGSAAGGATATAHSAHAPGGLLTPESLFGKSIPEAAIIALQAIKKPLHAKEIAEALEGAAYHHRSKNFVNTVNSILNRREETIGDVMKVGKAWALPEWYPGRRKAARAQASNGNGDDGSAS
jgi:hypothetical protein